MNIILKFVNPIIITGKTWTLQGGSMEYELQNFGWLLRVDGDAIWSF